MTFFIDHPLVSISIFFQILDSPVITVEPIQPVYRLTMTTILRTASVRKAMWAIRTSGWVTSTATSILARTGTVAHLRSVRRQMMGRLTASALLAASTLKIPKILTPVSWIPVPSCPLKRLLIVNVPETSRNKNANVTVGRTRPRLQGLMKKTGSTDLGQNGQSVHGSVSGARTTFLSGEVMIELVRYLDN